jgi:hypothetical protein
MATSYHRVTPNSMIYIILQVLFSFICVNLGDFAFVGLCFVICEIHMMPLPHRVDVRTTWKDMCKVPRI